MELVGCDTHERRVRESDPFPKLRFSPDGRFFVSSSHMDSVVIIWDYKTNDGYYQKFHECDAYEYVVDMGSVLIMIDVSPCSRYVVVLCDKHVLLNDIQNNGKKKIHGTTC
jgi:WD40 repeat protein